MRWVHRDTLDWPIYLSPNDKLELCYDVTYEFPVKKGFLGLKTGIEKKTVSKTLGNYPVGKEMTVDVVGVVEFDEEELASLGLDDALVGVFGESNGEKVADVRITEDQGKALLDREGLCYAA